MRNDLAPKVRALASEVFDRSWQFIESDPVLVGEDRQRMQDRLAELILLADRLVFQYGQPYCRASD